MTARWLRWLFAALLIQINALALAKEVYVYGPAPDWQRYQELGAAAVRAALPDPDAWQIEWPNGYLKAGWRHNGGPADGYLSCGVARASRPVAKYHPLTKFAVVIDHDVVKRVDISSRESNSLVNVLCNVLVQKGMMPPAAMMTTTALAAMPSTPSATTVFGVTIRSMPEGAYVTAVASGSAGARAGLTPGMVITAVNGITLVGMGPDMAKLLAADTPVMTLDTAAGGRLTVRPAG